MSTKNFIIYGTAQASSEADYVDMPLLNGYSDIVDGSAQEGPREILCGESGQILYVARIVLIASWMFDMKKVCFPCAYINGTEECPAHHVSHGVAVPITKIGGVTTIHMKLAKSKNPNLPFSGTEPCTYTLRGAGGLNKSKSGTCASGVRFSVVVDDVTGEVKVR